MEEKGIYFAHSTILFFSCRWALIWLLGKKNPSISASTLHCLCRFRCVRGCFGRLFRINCSFVPSFNKCAGIASCVQGAVFARAGDEAASLSAEKPCAVGMPTHCTKPRRAFLYRSVVRLSAEMWHWIPFCRFILFGNFCHGNLGTFRVFFLWFFFWILKAASFSSLCIYKLFLVLLGIADVKHSVTFGNINKPLKVHVQLDSLTCCPEVEASLTWEAFYGLSSSGKTIVFLLTFVLPVSLAVFLGAVEKQGAPF